MNLRIVTVFVGELAWRAHLAAGWNEVIGSTDAAVVASFRNHPQETWPPASRRRLRSLDAAERGPFDPAQFGNSTT